MNPLVSVVMPTHNRAKYALSSIEAFMDINSSKLELVVSDTSETNALQDYLNLRNTSLLRARVRYLRSPKELDLTGNHNAAISEARGAYVCLIGDDDAVTANLVQAAEWANSNQIACLSFDTVTNYAWPDFQTQNFGYRHAGRLYLPRVVAESRCCESEVALKNILANAAQGTEGMPKLYHGLVKRELLQEIKEISGAYVHGTSPDVSLAVALSVILSSRHQKYWTVNFPITLPGASGGSNTGRSAMGTHKGDLHGEEQTKLASLQGWSRGVPEFFSVETVWAQSCLTTLSAIGAQNKIKEFNYALLLALCSNSHPDREREISSATMQVVDILACNEKTLERRIRSNQVRLRVNRGLYLAKRAMWPTASGGRPFIAEIENVRDAIIRLSSYLGEKDMRVSDYLRKGD